MGKGKLHIAFSIGMLLSLFVSCDEELSLIHEGDSLPVVYGIFDIQDEIHRVKVNKTFVGEGDAYVMAENETLVNYPEATVTLTDGNGTFAFGAVDSIGKIDGPFPSFPNRFYKLVHQIAHTEIQIDIAIPEPPYSIRTTITPIRNFSVNSPSSSMRKFYFYEDPVVFSWAPSKDAGIYEIGMELTFKEVLLNGTINEKTIRHSIVLEPNGMSIEGKFLVYRFFSDPFYGSIARKIHPDPSVDYRQPTKFSMDITAGDTLLSRYMSWFTMEIDGQNNPNGNIPGGIGIIASKYTVHYPRMELSGRAQDSLIRGRFTRNLGFVANPDW